MTPRTVAFKFGVNGDPSLVQSFQVLRNGQPIGTPSNPAYPCSTALDRPDLTRWCVRDDNPPGGTTSYQIAANGTAAAGGGTATSDALVIETIAPPPLIQHCTFGVSFHQSGIGQLRKAVRTGKISGWFSTHDCAGKEITISLTMKRRGVKTLLGTSTVAAELQPSRVQFTIPPDLLKSLGTKGKVGATLQLKGLIDTDSQQLTKRI